MAILSFRMLNAVAMSLLDACETVTRCSSFVTTFFCIFKKECQRLINQRSFQDVALASAMDRSLVMRWWIVVTSGTPICCNCRVP